MATGAPSARQRPTPRKRARERAVRRLSAALEEALTEELPDPAELAHPVVAAESVGLEYVSDLDPGLRRLRSGKGFRYVDPEGRAVDHPETLRRIRSLAVPPAWTSVWIAPTATAHIQATGRDARGRKQYRYHPRWREVRDRSKYGRLLAFARALPGIRRRVEQDLSAPGLSQQKVLATVVRLLDTTGLRVGNEEYARTNNHFGVTTLHDRHVDVNGQEVLFRFVGKSGKEHRVTLREARLARIIKRCQDLPGQRLFQYLGENGQPRSIGSGDVNDYLREISGSDFTAKDFRTWNGTRLAAACLARCGHARTVREVRRQVLVAVDEVALRLGNTRAVCRRSYIHPAVISAYEEGTLRAARSARTVLRDFEENEALVVALLEATEAPAGEAAARRARKRRKPTRPTSARGLRTGAPRPRVSARAAAPGRR